MSGDRYRTRSDIEERFVRRELAERDFELLRGRVLLALTVVLVVVAIVCALRGAWPPAAAIGPCLTAILRAGRRY